MLAVQMVPVVGFLRLPPLQLVIHPLCQTKIENLLGLNAALDAARFAGFVDRRFHGLAIEQAIRRQSSGG